MSSFRFALFATAACGLASVATTGRAVAAPAVQSNYQHVLVISVDGMHAIDLANYVQNNPASNFAKLAGSGIVYPNAFTTAPSDSYPGMIAQFTGASPKTAGLFYDDSYDRTEFPSHNFYASQGLADPGCTIQPGTEVTNFEELDKSYNFATALVADITGGGTLGKVETQLDPDNMQRHLNGGRCLPTYPHDYLRTNTVFEVIKAAGGLTAWSDKHPAYEILNGPSGNGVDDMYTPEINSQVPGAPAGNDYTKSFTDVRTYDTTKVQAVLNWIDGYDSTKTRQPGTPVIYGMNFQVVSVGQKLAKGGYDDAPGLVGGYLDSNATPGNALSQQLQYVDNALGQFTAELEKTGEADSTLIIISAKHGQSPIDVSDRVIQSDTPFTLAPGFGTHGFEICDDVGLVWLQPQLQYMDYSAAKAYLLAHAAELHIQQLLDYRSLTPLYGSPFDNSRVPDFIAVTDHGAICTSGSKLAEHGGFSDDDRNVLLLLSAPKLKPEVVESLTYTTQIAPTILYALGIDPKALTGAVAEQTEVLGK